MTCNFISFYDLFTSAQAEESLYSSIFKKDYKHLNLPSFTYPHRYQGLPRNPSHHGLLHERFNDLACLKEKLIDKAILWAYHDHKIEKNHSIVIFSYVIPGGLGDYFAGLMTVQILKDHIPHATLHFMPILSEKAPKLIPSLHGETHEIRFASEKPSSLEIFKESHLKLLENASLILQIPTIFPLWEDLLTLFQKRRKKLHYESIGEYGFIHSTQFHPKTSTRCLGLHFLELGLFIPTQKQSFSLDILQPHFEKFSFKNINKPSLSYYFAYLYTKAGHQLYLHMLVESLKNNPASIDLFTPDIGKFLCVIEKIEKDPALRQVFIRAKIQKIDLLFADKKSTIHLQPNGKTLSIYHTGTLTHEEFLHFVHFSSEPIGIRGNLSVSEALSMKKAFFYDPIQHNLTFHQGLTALAEKRLKKFPSTRIFLALSAATDNLIDAGKSLAKAAESAKLREGFLKLSTIVIEEHRANELVACVVKRHLAHKRDPDLLYSEKNLLSQFSKGELSLKTLIKKLRLKITKES